MSTNLRRRELLAYASVCFKHMTSPFESIHLRKINVTLDECGNLSDEIAGQLADMVREQDLVEAEKLFQETQR
jgi:hypothetical protein